MKTFVLLFLSLSEVLVANEPGLSLSLKGSLTTSTRFLYNIDRVNSYSEEWTLSSNWGYGADARWRILWDKFFIGISVEKIGALEVIPEYSSANDIVIPVNEGFELTALELSGYYIVPISSEQIRFYLGGGFGMYDGDRNYSVAGVKEATVSTASNIGIHVLTGIDYQLFSRLAVRFEIKFRDPNFDVTSKFDQQSVEYQGKRIQLPQGLTVTKINLYGVNYAGGLVITL